MKIDLGTTVDKFDRATKISKKKKIIIIKYISSYYVVCQKRIMPMNFVVMTIFFKITEHG